VRRRPASTVESASELRRSSQHVQVTGGEHVWGGEVVWAGEGVWAAKVVELNPPSGSKSWQLAEKRDRWGGLPWTSWNNISDDAVDGDGEETLPWLPLHAARKNGCAGVWGATMVAARSINVACFAASDATLLCLQLLLPRAVGGVLHRPPLDVKRPLGVGHSLRPLLDAGYPRRLCNNPG
jgi:hypothetical protein